MKLENGPFVFSFGELWTSGDEWTCEEEECDEKTNLVVLSPDDTSKLEKEFADSLEGLGLCGSDVARAILERCLGEARCRLHSGEKFHEAP